MLPMILAAISILKKYNADGFLINTSDYHDNEYIGPSDEILKEVTKFTGSNGIALITEKRGFIYTDSRYFLQIQKEIDTDYFDVIKDTKDFYKAIKNTCKSILLDKRYFSKDQFDKLSEKLENVNIKFEKSVVDEIWNKRPLKLFQPVIDLEKIMISEYVDKIMLETVGSSQAFIKKDTNVTGSRRENKVNEVLNEIGDDILILTALDEIAWMLNLRGNDIPYNPVFYSYLMLSKDRKILFTGTQVDLKDFVIKDYTDFEDEISYISNKNVRVSPTCNSFIYDLLVSNGNKVSKFDLIDQKKSQKNEVEVFGFKCAHIYDAIALTKLFDQIDNHLKSNPSSEITEQDVGNELISHKNNFKAFVSPSFETISAFGENGAIVHHRGGLTKVDTNNLLLIDSGSQYYFGTTDVTRTLCFGNPTAEQKTDFTTVLKGQIDTMTAVINKNYASSHLDILTRAPIWKLEIDYGHSTGHGVGHFLNVHESPPVIGNSGKVLEENMIFSVEPGIYRENKYGIRIEDLVVVLKKSADYFFLENLTLAPLQMKLIDKDLLDKRHKDYINMFNKRCFNILSAFIKEGDLGYNFLLENTKPI
ncbi:hypothetical protein EDEG_02181 [Edhazardia aedis USNM 41457]|uniref:Xaa-Pro aminopeptidase n=1 Tax=Edhazardia aedis (strain USNM 41457) TaxID=1003232 RepID=J9DLM0_EDHAE|nr:hypothetical protein EDEG_02181 [Edhazardia aedis USNM 41457]|eukprot:EJW03485.1 hypothetical protein EDEG_02181 [Edhazardia aedis USNM 41457]